MECNSDQAVSAIDKANVKFSKGDFHGAKMLALKAKKLFPILKGLAQMMPVLEIHTAAQSKLGGIVIDWYRILQVDPDADVGSIKKQYRKLALVIHPDKNQAMGAEAAFKLLSEASETLSDKEKRAHYEMEREQAHQDMERELAHQDMESGQAHDDMERDIVWTACPHCKKQYEYLRKFKDYEVQCSDCKRRFVIEDHYMERDTICTVCPSCKKDHQYLRKYENHLGRCSGCNRKFVIQDVYGTVTGNCSHGNEEDVEEENLEDMEEDENLEQMEEEESLEHVEEGNLEHVDEEENLEYVDEEENLEYVEEEENAEYLDKDETLEKERDELLRDHRKRKERRGVDPSESSSSPAVKASYFWTACLNCKVPCLCKQECKKISFYCSKCKPNHKAANHCHFSSTYGDNLQGNEGYNWSKRRRRH